MAFQYGTTLRNNQVGQIQTTIGASGTLKIFSGAEPANCAAADPSGLLATITLPAVSFPTRLGVASPRSREVGVWRQAPPERQPVLGCTTAPWVRHVQGNVTTDLVLNNTSITSGQTVTVTSFTVTAGNQ